MGSEGRLQLEDYPLRSIDKVRFSDTDKFGHVSNAVFGVYFETGRGELLHGGADDLADPGCFFVLVRTTIDYLAELNWPGEIASGTRVLTIGNSSLSVEQALFQNGKYCASATSTLVQFDPKTGKARPISAQARERLSRFILP